MTAENRPTYYTLAEAAALSRLSETTLRRHIYAGNLRANGTSGKILIRPKDLDDWLIRRARLS